MLEGWLFFWVDIEAEEEFGEGVFVEKQKQKRRVGFAIMGSKKKRKERAAPCIAVSYFPGCSIMPILHSKGGMSML